MEQKEMEKKFSNEENQYYAHGIGAYDENVIKSIFQNGLRCSHNELYWTVVEFGKGSDTLFREKEELMNNWDHKSSKHIMVASLPEVFHLLDVKGTALFQKKHAAFYNSISPEESSRLGISPGLYLKPEFVMGMYDAENKDFVSNDRYYENLPEQEQKRVLDEIKRQYIDIIENSDWTLEEYAQILDDIGIKCPLTQEEISNNGKVVEQQLDMVELPSGVKIPRKQYEEEQGTIKQSKGISIGEVKESVKNSKVTSQEAKNVTQDMKKMKEIKKINFMQKTGQTLTPEQTLLLDEHIRQTQQAQMQFQQRQANEKSNGNGIEM